MSRAFFLVGPEDRQRLTLLAQAGTRRMAARARIVLLSEQGLSVEQIASELAIVPPTVYKWRKRFAERGISGLYDLPRPGQPLKLTEQRKQTIIRLVTDAVPEDALEWSIRRLAKAAGITEHQARSVLASRRLEPPSSVNDLGWPLHLAAMALAPPLVGAALLVDPYRRTSEAVQRQAYVRLARIRNDPSSLYRAFRTSQVTTPVHTGQVSRLLDVLAEFSDALPHALELVVAPAHAFATALPAAPTRVVALPSVGVWLRTVESTLLWFENEALEAPAGALAVKALRTRLAQHSAQAPPLNHSEFFWRNPYLNSPPRGQR